jgi:hypothetical protein
MDYRSLTTQETRIVEILYDDWQDLLRCSAIVRPDMFLIWSMTADRSCEHEQTKCAQRRRES